jgi:endonuclease/exonuclease/phosphatase family metal-dependent hydrolase
MPVRVCKGFGWASFSVAAMLLAFAGPAMAQTVSLPAADTTLRPGMYEDTNFGSQSYVETKASTNPDTYRRAILKFDTHTTIPVGSQINSATLTLTVRSGSVPTRTISYYCVPSSFDEFQSTWHVRKGTLDWATAGGDLGHKHGEVTVTNVAGSKVTIDVTAITREAMQTSSRYTRVMLIDRGTTATRSYLSYYSRQSSASLQPKLVVNYGSSTPPPPDPAPTTTTTTLRVLQWNVQQGHTTDGRSNYDLVADWVIKMKADVISFNEIIHYESPSADMVAIIANKLAAKTGRRWYYKWVQKWGAASGEGEAVMSRFPFRSTGEYLLPVQRSVAEGLVISVNGRNINLFSTHLDANSTSYRLSQIRELKPWAASFAQQRIIMGDFNAWPGTTEYSEMTKDYRDAWAVALSKGTAVAYAANPEGNTRRSRIDYVWYSSGASSLELTRAQVFDTRDPATGARPSDHNPLLATFVVH